MKYYIVFQELYNGKCWEKRFHVTTDIGLLTHTWYEKMKFDDNDIAESFCKLLNQIEEQRRDFAIEIEYIKRRLDDLEP